MVRFHQVRELVQWAAQYHAHLAELYSSKATEEASDSRIRMALKYVAELEASMQKELERYLAEDSDHHGVLETWFEEAVEAPATAVSDETPDVLKADTTGEVLSATLNSHKTLQDLFADRAKHASSTSERELFESLISQYEAESRRFSRNMQRLEDY